MNALLTLLSLLPFFAFAAQSTIPKPTYEEIIERAIAPQDLTEKLDHLFANGELIRAFVTRENLMTNAERAKIATKYQMDKLAAYNYVFRTPLLPGYILKFGPIHWTNSHGGKAVRAEEVSNKNVSRVAYQQLAEDVIAMHNLQRVRVVKKHLYRVGTNTLLCDENYIVVAQDLQAELLSYEENIKRFASLTEEELNELKLIAREAFIADLKPENCMFGRNDGIIYLIDTEQTNKALESDFFLENPERMRLDTESALKKLAQFQKEEHISLYLKEKASAHLYTAMGIELDDKPTVTKEAEQLSIAIHAGLA